MRVALKLAYDGTLFYGYARQPNLKTVEGEIIKTCIETGLFHSIEDANPKSASRTDKGVSSLCNVFVFNTTYTPREVLSILSENLPLDTIIPYATTKVNNSFNPRHALLRHYRYYIPKENRDINRIREISKVFLGLHDFTNFAKIEPGKTPNRKISNISIKLEGGLIVIDFYAPTFLWNQIRRIVSAILKAERGEITIEDISSALGNPNVRVDHGVAPAEPLILMDIRYKNISFEYHPTLTMRCKKIEDKIRKRVKSLSF